MVVGGYMGAKEEKNKSDFQKLEGDTHANLNTESI